MRKSIIKGNIRVDGRDTTTVRPILSEIGIIPRAHGSALFTRGHTQAIVTVTLGNDKDAKIIESYEGDKRDRIMLHYNFPPYSVGECGIISMPKRREIGHGELAKKAIINVIPSEKKN